MKEDSVANQDRFVRLRMSLLSGFGADLLPVISNTPLLRDLFHVRIVDRGSNSRRQKIRGAVLLDFADRTASGAPGFCCSNQTRSQEIDVHRLPGLQPVSVGGMSSYQYGFNTVLGQDGPQVIGRQGQVPRPFDETRPPS